MESVWRAARKTFDILMFVNIPIRRKFALFSAGVSFWLLVLTAVGLFIARGETERLVILAASGVAHLLLVVFAITITHSLTRPIEAMIEQIRILTEGDLNNLERVEIASGDELGELSTRFNRLLDALHELNSFKKVIEEDDTAEDVYVRLGHIFEKHGVGEHVIYERAPEGKGLRVVGGTQKSSSWCRPEVLINGDLCRARKTGAPVSSALFPAICKQFAAEGCEHICVPLLVGGRVAGVVQFVQDTQSGESIDDVRARVEKVERFMKEAVPVLEAKRLHETLHTSAIHDPLTGLYNRRFLCDFEHTLVAAVKRHRASAALLMFDIDYFKQVNDMHGHDVGDAVLQAVARTIVKSLRAADIVVRWGGEEFLAVLQDVANVDPLEVAERSRAAVEASEIMARGVSVRRTVSVGVSLFPRDAGTLAECINLADVAMYRAKVGGRNRVVGHTRDAEDGVKQTAGPAQSPTLVRAELAQESTGA